MSQYSQATARSGGIKEETTAIVRATSMMVLGATSVFGQVDRRSTISRPTLPTTTPQDKRAIRNHSTDAHADQ